MVFQNPHIYASSLLFPRRKERKRRQTAEGKPWTCNHLTNNIKSTTNNFRWLGFHMRISRLFLPLARNVLQRYTGQKSPIKHQMKRFVFHFLVFNLIHQVSRSVNFFLRFNSYRIGQNISDPAISSGTNIFFFLSFCSLKYWEGITNKRIWITRKMQKINGGVQNDKEPKKRKELESTISNNIPKSRCCWIFLFCLSIVAFFCFVKGLERTRSGRREKSDE